MPLPRLLFSAPHAFLEPAFHEQLRARYEVELREAWTLDELAPGSDAEAWIVNPGQHFVVDDAILDRFPVLRALVTPSTGTNHIDVPACESRGISVRGLLDDRAALDRISASAEFTFLLVLNALRRLDLGLEEVRGDRWRRDESRLRGRELQGKRVGLLGYGRIGRRLARWTAAFDATPLFHDPYVDEVDTVAERQERLAQLVAAADVLVVCCALTPETRGLVTGSLLAALPPGAAIVNTSRGEVLDEPSVASLLDSRPDLAFATDVLAGEVRGAHSASPLRELFDRGRILVTPHMAGATVESQTKAAFAALALLEEALART